MFSAMQSFRFNVVVATMLWHKSVATSSNKSVATSSDEHSFLGSRSIRIGHWNVYWKALNYIAGQEAVTNGIDAAVQHDGPFDFFALLEASGSSHSSSFPGWVEKSEAFKSDGLMKYLHGKSFHETIALYYRANHWEPIWSEVNQFARGRPFITALFKLRHADNETEREGEGFGACANAVWVIAAHLPHFTSRYGRPAPNTGAHMAGVLAKGAAITGCEAAAMPTVIVGDFNEFGECSVPPNVHCREPGFHRAARTLLPLWDYFGGTGVADATAATNATCCTKWHENVRNDWWHHYDHMYYTKAFLNVSKRATFIPYAYPGIPSCTGAACTGPFHGAPPRSQGSWHRGLQTTLSPRHLPVEFVV